MSKRQRCKDCKKLTDAGPCPGCGVIVCQNCAEREGEFCCDGEPSSAAGPAGTDDAERVQAQLSIFGLVDESVRGALEHTVLAFIRDDRIATWNAAANVAKVMGEECDRNGERLGANVLYACMTRLSALARPSPGSPGRSK